MPEWLCSLDRCYFSFLYQIGLFSATRLCPYLEVGREYFVFLVLVGFIQILLLQLEPAGRSSNVHTIRFLFSMLRFHGRCVAFGSRPETKNVLNQNRNIKFWKYKKKRNRITDRYWMRSWGFRFDSVFLKKLPF